MFYESHTVLHGRPFPMNGSFYANVFVHFIPLDHDDMNEHDFKLHDKMRGVGGHESANHDSEDIVRRQRLIRQRQEIDEEDEGPVTVGQNDLHVSAALGDLKGVQSILAKSKENVNSRDENGWQPIHEAAHGGHLEITKLLVDAGADINAKSNNGGTPLWWAKGALKKDDPVILYLNSIDAEDGNVST